MSLDLLSTLIDPTLCSKHPFNLCPSFRCSRPIIAQLHPFNQQRDIVKYCEENGIVVQAYSPLLRNKKANDVTLNEIGKTYEKTVAQVLIRYCLQKDWVPLPKSDTPSRILENADVYDFELSKEDMKTLDGLHRGPKGSVVQSVSNTI